jgi:hypothetical protein
MSDTKKMSALERASEAWRAPRDLPVILPPPPGELEFEPVYSSVISRADLEETTDPEAFEGPASEMVARSIANDPHAAWCEVERAMFTLHATATSRKRSNHKRRTKKAARSA